MFLKSQAGGVKSENIINYLKELRQHLKKRKLLLLWDGLPAHRAKIVTAFVKTRKHWLKVVRFPAYAPELNPPEYLWSSMKAKDLSNLRPDGMKALGKAVQKGYRRIRKREDLLLGFLKASGLFKN